MCVLIARLELLDGLRITLEYLSGILYSNPGLIVSDKRVRQSVNCASIHRKIGTHITKVYAR